MLDILKRFLTSLKYILGGLFIWVIGAMLFGGTASFQSSSEPAELRVIELQSKRDREGQISFRPLFALTNPDVQAEPYAGNKWSSLSTHKAGDIVAGRYDAQSGEMRSDNMLTQDLWLGRIVRGLSLFIALQGLAILFGVPESRLPLPVSRRRDRHAMVHWG